MSFDTTASDLLSWPSLHLRGIAYMKYCYLAFCVTKLVRAAVVKGFQNFFAKVIPFGVGAATFTAQMPDILP